MSVHADAPLPVPPQRPPRPLLAMLHWLCIIIVIIIIILILILIRIRIFILILILIVIIISTCAQ